jgi:hypothetical protein
MSAPTTEDRNADRHEREAMPTQNLIIAILLAAPDPPRAPTTPPSRNISA